MPIRNLMLTLLLFTVSSLCIAGEVADRQAIESSAQQWVSAFHAQSATALAALTTTDVLVLNGDGRPVQGALGASQTWIRAAAVTGTLVSTTKEIVISGDAAWRVALLSYQQSGGEKHRGQALEIWTRTNGAWKLHRQMSSNIIAAALRPAPSEPMLDQPTH